MLYSVSQMSYILPLYLVLMNRKKQVKKINWYTFSNGPHDGFIVLVVIVVLYLLPHFLLLLLHLPVGSIELENHWWRKITHIWCQKTPNKTIKVTYNISCNKNKFQDYAWNIFMLPNSLLSTPNFNINESDNTKFYLTTLNIKDTPNCYKPHL